MSACMCQAVRIQEWTKQNTCPHRAHTVLQTHHTQHTVNSMYSMFTNDQSKKKQSRDEERQHLGRAGLACGTVAREGFTEKRTCSENERKWGAREPAHALGKGIPIPGTGRASTAGGGPSTFKELQEEQRTNKEWPREWKKGRAEGLRSEIMGVQDRGQIR